MGEKNECKIESLIHPFTPLQLQRFLDKCNKDYLNVALCEGLKKPFDVAEIDEKIAFILERKAIQVSTSEGLKSIVLVSKKTKDLLQEDMIVMPTDLSTLSKMVVIGKNEIQVLASLEKPIMELKVNLIYKNKKNLDQDFVKVKMYDTLLLYYICKKLFAFKRLLETAAKNIQPNHKIYINKAFSLE